MIQHQSCLCRLTTLAATALFVQAAGAAYHVTASRALAPGEVAVTGPGNYDKAGTTYVLTQDVRAPRSAIFLGKDVILDLNGHTLTYADGGYEHVLNYRFDEGLKHWDTSKAPGAKVRPAQWNRMGSDNVCVLPEGEELVSEYVTLPVSNRAYYALATLAHQTMQAGIYVEDEQGKSIECTFHAADGSDRRCCPEPGRSPEMGGGTVFALLFGQPAGKYRIRVKALQRDCVIGAIDLRPAMDVGISIVEKTLPWAYYRCILDGDGCAFFDYTKPGHPGEPVDTIPHVGGAGTVTIRNGVIRSGFEGIRSWGVQSTARDVRMVVENVKFVASGINTYALCAPFATLTNCRTEIDTPWIISRHRQGDVAVSLLAGRSADASLISACEFIGGQGQLTVHGDQSDIRDNLFVNKQTVVNHYSLNPGGKGTKVHGNRFLPEQGSGLELFMAQGVEVFSNTFVITASPPINELYGEDYSVSAIRLADYGRTKESGKPYCGNNAIYDNTIRIVGRLYPDVHKNYKPMVYGIFMSVSGDQNDIHDNDITVEQQNPPNGDDHGAYAFYIGASKQGGTYYRNRITANVTPVWISNMYGQAQNATFYENTFTRSPGAGEFAWVKLGWFNKPTHDIRFFSNTFAGQDFSVWINDYTTKFVSEYDVGWTLTVATKPGAEIVAFDKDGKEAAGATADGQGAAVLRLVQYKARGEGESIENGKRQVRIGRTDVSDYTVRANGKTLAVKMDQDRRVAL